ncbi:branched-chain amino acid ABC transporter permease [Desulfobotulus sp. H1]|uniref:Branched-chain amino acid ABC transporter permease n=1 Tax=Desulfobotulus pelophilus TaxID=2823377 RepID=A0ABT3N8R0_9BACT|nr:branched-chain amino acid ABC transporter permease [Desulfobotulus pelophilus]MCW7753846.1 branched-chain amino acid ABC transporter permease [Desulfobotulus pelophilus]
MNRNVFITSVLLAFFACFPVLFSNPYWIGVLNDIWLYAILGLSLNWVVGHTGLFNLGHAAYYAVGAYTAAIISTHFNIPILWLIPVAGFTAGLFALVVARPIIHLRGDYLAIVTIGVGEIVRIALENDIFGITGGSNGIFGIPRPEIFDMRIRRPWQFYYLIGGFLLITIWFFYRLEQSRFGRALNYIKEDETAAEGSGINTAWYKLAAFVIGAVWAGMAGTLFAAKMSTVSPGSFVFWESVLIFAIVILGGAGSIPGVILGAFLLVGLPEFFRNFADARMLFFGAAMVLMMIFRSRGLLPPLTRKYAGVSRAGGGDA